MYKKGTVGYIEVLLDSTDISDFITRADMIKKVINHDVNLLDFMKKEKNEIVAVKKQLEVQQINVASVQRKVEAKKNELVVASRAKEVLLGDLSADRATMERQYDSLNSEADALSATIAHRQREHASKMQQRRNARGIIMDHLRDLIKEIITTVEVVNLFQNQWIQEQLVQKE